MHSTHGDDDTRAPKFASERTERRGFGHAIATGTSLPEFLPKMKVSRPSPPANLSLLTPPANLSFARAAKE